MNQDTDSRRRPCRRGGRGLACPAALAAALLGTQPFGDSAAQSGPASLLAQASPKTQSPVDHSSWTALPKVHIRRGADGVARVDYAAFKQRSRPQLQAYIRSLESSDLRRLDRNDQFALLANLYNARTVDIVLDRYPIRSIRDINLGGSLLATLGGGPWRAKVVRLGGIDLSLDDLEHAMLRPVFRDPRIHYAVNCASLGCPDLREAAFTGISLQAQLDDAARDFINHPRAVTRDGGRWIVSSLYQWYRSDFGVDDAAVLAHLRQYARPPLAQQLASVARIDGYRYD